jgi:hypothetical protein
MTLDEAIKHCLEVAEQNETQAQKIGRQLVGSAIDKYATDCRECAADHRQLAEWLTELKEWKENPFRRIKAECKENYYCNNCAFIDHCPFSNGNRVAAEYPMDWVIY